MARKSVKLKPEQTLRRYVGIDVTGALDTVAWGHMWKANFGWQNLLWELDVDPAVATIRVDKGHPTMPIQLLERTHRGIKFKDTCIMPGGVDGSGTSASYPEADREAACTFMETFILSPGADPATSKLNDTGAGAVADIVFLSSHGLSNGDMFGGISYIFYLGVAATSGKPFSGPGWLILANCSTLDPSTRGDWLDLMKGPNPLRGIVGFQNGCPLERGTVDFVGLFIKNLAKGSTFLRAWKDAVTAKVSRNNWVVLCHENAKNDTISDWNDSKLKAIPPGGDVLMFDNSNPSGSQVVRPVDPFEVFWSKGGTRITPQNKQLPANRLKAGDSVVITVKQPPSTPFTTGTTIVITLVYIRLDYPQGIDVTKMFTVTGQTGASSTTTTAANLFNTGGDDSWELAVTGTPAEVTLSLDCKDLSMLKDTLMPLWLRVDSTNLITPHEFKRNGAMIEEK